jgi:hypothetical protein
MHTRYLKVGQRHFLLHSFQFTIHYNPLAQHSYGRRPYIATSKFQAPERWHETIRTTINSVKHNNFFPHSEVNYNFWFPGVTSPLCSIINRNIYYITYISYIYTGCPKRNVPDFGRVFLILKYTDITQNTYIQSWTVTEITAREKCGLLAVPLTAPVQLTHYVYTAHVRPSSTESSVTLRLEYQHV